ncbi:MAG: DNA repair protein RadC [Candidatus Sumerlaeaceae bacterium]|nr:DNA repair protein RadC [Candidatus Sumerlaeaceae bacterium]
MDDIQIVECLEAIRNYLLAEDPKIGETLRDTQTNGLLRHPGQMKQRLIAVVLGLDDTLPAARRKLRRFAAMHPTLADHLSPVDFVAEESGSNDGLCLPRRRQELLEKSLAAFDGFDQELAACTTPSQAAALTRQRLPILRGRRVQEYLAAVGFPVLPRSTGIERVMVRLGLVTGRSAAEFESAAERACRAAVITHAELALLLGLFSGARRHARHEPICTLRPRCHACPLTAHCLYWRVHGAPSPAPVRNYTPIRDWTEDARPRERLLNGHHLPDAELLAIVLGTGTGSTSAVDLARVLLGRFQTLHRLSKATPGELKSIKGIGAAKAAHILAALELGKRAAAREADIRVAQEAPFTDSAGVFERYRARFMGETQERFLALLLNTRNRLIREVEVSVGTLNASIVHPREAFRHAITETAAAVIFLHNHPSGDPSPSAADREMTRRLVETGQIVGIRVLDHVIIGAHSHYSFADNGEIS